MSCFAAWWNWMSTSRRSRGPRASANSEWPNPSAPPRGLGELKERLLAHSVTAAAVDTRWTPFSASQSVMVRGPVGSVGNPRPAPRRNSLPGRH